MRAKNYDDSTCQKALTFPLQFCWRARCRALVLFGGIAALFVALLLSAIPIPALAVDATWLDAPASADWNLGSNWSGGIAPVNSGDTATFGASTQTSPTLSDNVTIASVTFSRGASAFSIQVGAFPVTLRLQGDGIMNDSGTCRRSTTAQCQCRELLGHIDRCRCDDQQQRSAQFRELLRYRCECNDQQQRSAQ